ncbi:hypothetical protein EV207_15610 [Scopulibacillus darangshiensis]|uniref:YkoS n=1 Tax=Scopulibacillus darangshiensis TaxID=442528 RepID=A0A4R2NFV5_9BACL|nr:DUF6044 family protein [Scopulibacillus darangshiensis]TCP19974.1 hypothetical protein EV207_15610 [Scopulibacillus darangshiensis]
MIAIIKKYKGVIIGVAILLLYLSPLYILQGQAHVRVHDNLDSNVVWYKLLADSGKIFAPNDAPIPNIINGLPRISLPSAFSFMLWLNILFSPLSAYIINMTLMRFIAFFGMMLLLKNHIIRERKSAGMIIGVALCFAILPYWPPGGLTIAGLPIVLYAFLHIRKRMPRIWDWLIIVLVPFYSSFVLSFFFFLLIMGLVWLWDVLKQKDWNWRFFLSIALMTGVYLIVEYRLVMTTLFGLPFVSHREEFNLGHLSFESTLRLIVKNFTLGHTHVLTEHLFVVLPVTILAIIAAFFWRQVPKRLLFVMAIIIIFCIEYAFWYWEGTRWLKNTVSFFNTFNFSRFHFLHPLLWYIAFALALSIFCRRGKGGRALAMVLIGLQVLVLFNVNPELKYRRIDYPSFQEFYSPKLFHEIKAYIGKDPEDYRVASIGIHPAVAQYNGFYTLDAYNNIYPLKYKHQFRQIIAPELAKNKTLETYYDTWGGRCYLFVDKLGKHYMFTKKHNVVLKHLDFNIQAFKDLGGAYIFSAVKIGNAEENHLTLLKIFERQSSPWKIYLYKAT